MQQNAISFANQAEFKIELHQLSLYGIAFYSKTFYLFFRCEIDLIYFPGNKTSHCHKCLVICFHKLMKTNILCTVWGYKKPKSLYLICLPILVWACCHQNSSSHEIPKIAMRVEVRNALKANSITIR